MVENSSSSGQHKADVIPYRAWWGLAGCAAFMAVILVLAPYSTESMLEPDHGDWWYAWQLKDATVWTRLSAWLPYVVHQVSIWFLITQARNVRPRYIFGLHSFNVWALAINGGFALLHVAQTKLFYDGLAQDVHEMTSMGSVTLMLFLIMLMENGRARDVFRQENPGSDQRRGYGAPLPRLLLLVGNHIYVLVSPGRDDRGGTWPASHTWCCCCSRAACFSRAITRIAGGPCAWKPCSSVHGALVAFFIMQRGENGPWSMFLFGGVAVFLITQLHGLGLTARGQARHRFAADCGTRGVLLRIPRAHHGRDAPADDHVHRHIPAGGRAVVADSLRPSPPDPPFYLTY